MLPRNDHLIDDTLPRTVKCLPSAFTQTATSDQSIVKMQSMLQQDTYRQAHACSNPLTLKLFSTCTLCTFT